MYVIVNIGELIKLGKSVFVYYGWSSCTDWFQKLDPEGKNGNSEAEALKSYVEKNPIKGIIIKNMDFDVSTGGVDKLFFYVN